jgi:hypothetical protein
MAEGQGRGERPAERAVIVPFPRQKMPPSSPISDNAAMDTPPAGSTHAEKHRHYRALAADFRKKAAFTRTTEAAASYTTLAEGYEMLARSVARLGHLPPFDKTFVHEPD